MDIKEEKMRYMKKKPSSKSKAKEKADHKHDYYPVLIKHINKGEKTDNNSFYTFGKKCKICGIVKYGNIDSEKYISAIKLDDGCYRMIPTKELQNLYPELEICEKTL